MERETISTFKDLLLKVDGTIGSLPPKSVRPHKVGCSLGEMAHMLSVSYSHILDSRGLRTISDANLTRNIRATAKWLTDARTKPSLLLWGQCGNGKTTMINSVREVIVSLKSCRSGVMLNMPDDGDFGRSASLLDGLPEIVGSTTATKLCYLAESEPDKFATVCGMDLLLVDDAGSEPRAVKRYGTDTNPFTEMIYERYESMLPTVISTNLSPDKLTMLYGGRVGDRLREMCEVIEFTNPSYRR